MKINFVISGTVSTFVMGACQFGNVKISQFFYFVM